MSQPIRLAIVEDDAGLREVLQGVFNSASDFRVVLACPDGETALRELGAKAPNVVLMDINLPGMVEAGPGPSDPLGRASRLVGRAHAQRKGTELL